MYHLPSICHTLVPEICVRPKVLSVFWYNDVVHMQDCQDI